MIDNLRAKIEAVMYSDVGQTVDQIADGRFVFSGPKPAIPHNGAGAVPDVINELIAMKVEGLVRQHGRKWYLIANETD